MSVTALRPVGMRIPADSGRRERLEDRLGRDIAWLASGTAALALAVRLAIEKTGARRVVLPAYGCPDLVAATLQAGGVPLLVDTLVGSPFIDPARLAQVDAPVAAVVGVHFLGMAQDLAALGAAAGNLGAVLIEDSAQLLPAVRDSLPAAELAIYSFGRGKPAGALGGGALAYSAGWKGRVPGNLARQSMERVSLALQLKRAAYNTLVRRDAYGLVRRLPGTRLGETRYVELRSIEPMDPALGPIIDTMVAAAPVMPTRAQAWIATRLGRLVGRVDDLGARLGAGRPLLRYPLLLPDRLSRDRALAALDAAGLGASAMYGFALADLPGMPQLEITAIDNARDFADRLLTLPTHEDVTEADVERMVVMLGASL